MGSGATNPPSPRGCGSTRTTFASGVCAWTHGFSRAHAGRSWAIPSGSFEAERAMRRARGLYEALRNVSLKALSLGLERLCRLVVVVAMAPVIGQVAFGQYVYASTVTALLALGTDLGLGVWTTRSV